MTGQRLVLRTLCVALLTVGSGVRAQASAEQQGGKGWIALALLPKVGEALVNSSTMAASCVFHRLFSFLGAGTNPNSPACNSGGLGNVVQPNSGFNQYGQPIQPVAGQAGQPYPGTPPGQALPSYPLQAQGGYTPAPAAPATTGFTSGQAAALSTQPMLSFVVQQLSSHMPQAQVQRVLAQDRLSQQTEPSFTLATGEAFAIQFSTSVPGRVRLINTDVDAAVSQSPIYEAVPGGDNRMPREHEGGILMTGKPGTEYLEVEFVPCISAALTQHPAVRPFQGMLPDCAMEPATKQYRPALANGGGGLAAMGGKAMAFPQSGDPTQPVAIAPGNYAKGEMLRFRLRIQHVPKS